LLAAAVLVYAWSQAGDAVGVIGGVNDGWAAAAGYMICQITRPVIAALALLCVAAADWAWVKSAISVVTTGR
jgi:hypothetical protein